MTRMLLIALAVCAGLPAADLPEWKKPYVPEGEAWKKVAQHLVINNDSEPEGLDPALIKGVLEGRIALALFEGLTVLDPATLEPRPGVAESWDVSDDRLTYTFHLRAEAKWSDGQPLTAEDFVKSWRRVIEPATGSEYAGQLYPVAGAEDYHHGKLKDAAKLGFVATDAHTLAVRLRAPCSYFLDLTAFATLSPVRVDLVERFGDQWTLPEHLIGNGPFTLAGWKPRQAIELARNERYWDRAFVKLERITILPYDDPDAAFKKFLEGEIHYLPSVPPARLDELKRRPDYYVAPYLGTYFYRFNCTQKPFSDQLVRQAFSRAIDRKAITDQVLRAGQLPATWFCPDVAGYHHVDGLGYDVEAARKLLADAGYPGGKDFPEVRLIYNTSEAHKQVAQAVAQQWKEHLGVTVTLANSEWKTYLSDTRTLNYGIARASWIGDYDDPNTFMDMWETGGGNNETGWSNAEYDKLLAQARVEPDNARRLATLQAMERILVEKELPIMPVYGYVSQSMRSPLVHGWAENIRDLHPYQYLWLEE